MEAAITAAVDEFEAKLAAARDAFTAATDGATAQLGNWLDSRRAWWDDHRAQEVERAKWTKDSFYRYHLLRLA